MYKTLVALSLGVAMLAVAAPAIAENTATSTSNAQKIACVGAAVNTREQAMVSAQSTFSGAVNSAYSARASALASAYQQTSIASIKTAVKTAWSNFNTSVKSARKTWQAARNTAWANFRTSAKACKAGSLGATDESHAGSEVSGN